MIIDIKEVTGEVLRKQLVEVNPSIMILEFVSNDGIPYFVKTNLYRFNEFNTGDKIKVVVNTLIENSIIAEPYEETFLTKIEG